MGQPRWLSGLAPPSAQGLILETQDRVPRRAPCVEPASPSACVSHELINKIFKEKKNILSLLCECTEHLCTSHVMREPNTIKDPKLPNCVHECGTREHTHTYAQQKCKAFQN